MRYFQVKYAGKKFNDEDELNGIAFQAVGSGTVVEYVQVHNGSDDGIEFFGGTVGIKYFVVTGASDDSVDWTDGWRGFAQWGVVAQTIFPATDSARAKDRMIEADNYGSDMDREPRSFPRMSNITFVQDNGGSNGILLREGTGLYLLNSIVAGNPHSAGYCLDIDDDETYRHAESSMNGIRFEGSLFDSVKCGQMAVDADGNLVGGFFDPSSNDSGDNIFDAGGVLEAQPNVQIAASGLHGSSRRAAYLTHPLVNSYYADKVLSLIHI